MALHLGKGNTIFFSGRENGIQALPQVSIVDSKPTFLMLGDQLPGASHHVSAIRAKLYWALLNFKRCYYSLQLGMIPLQGSTKSMFLVLGDV